MTAAAAVHHKGYHALHHDPETAALAVAELEAAHAAELRKERKRIDAAWLTGRLLMAAVFIGAAVVKALAFSDVSAVLEAREMAAPGALIAAAIVIELGAGVLLAGGLFVRRAALALIVWLGMVTVFMHWDLRDGLNRSFALSNVAIAAGLFLLAAHGAGIFSLDALRSRRALRRELA